MSFLRDSKDKIHQERKKEHSWQEEQREQEEVTDDEKFMAYWKCCRESDSLGDTVSHEWSGELSWNNGFVSGAVKNCSSDQWFQSVISRPSAPSENLSEMQVSQTPPQTSPQIWHQKLAGRWWRPGRGQPSCSWLSLAGTAFKDESLLVEGMQCLVGNDITLIMLQRTCWHQYSRAGERRNWLGTVQQTFAMIYVRDENTENVPPCTLSIPRLSRQVTQEKRSTPTQVIVSNQFIAGAHITNSIRPSITSTPCLILFTNHNLSL